MIKKRSFVLYMIAMFAFATLLSCGIFALVAKSVSFNIVMKLNPTIYFGLELQVDSNGDGDFSDSFTSNNVDFNESAVYTIFDNRITNFVDHEPWAIVNLNKIVLQNTDAINNPFGDLGVNACFKIKVLNYTSATDLGVDENSAEMQALWLTLNPTEFSSMYAVPEYGVQNVAYGSFKEFMIYPQSITTDYFEIPFTVELKTKTIDHAINAITTEANPSGSGETVTITLDSPQNTITNGHDFIASFKTKFDTIKIASVTLGGNEIAYTYTNQTKQIMIAGSNIFDLNSANSLQIHIEKVGYMLTDGSTLNRLLNGGVSGPNESGYPEYPNLNRVLLDCTFDLYHNQDENISGYSTINIGLGNNADKILLYIDATTPTHAYILSNYNIFANYSCVRMFFGYCAITAINLNNFDSFYTTNFVFSFAWMQNASASLSLNCIDTSNATTLASMFWQCWALKNLDVSTWNTSKVTNLRSIFCCSSISSIVGIENWDTSKVKDFAQSFYLTSIKTLDLTTFNTSNATDMLQMFAYNYQLTSLTIPFTTTNVTNMSHMFNNCRALSTVNSTTAGEWNLNFNTANATNMQQMFYDCNAMKTLNISSFNTEKVTNMSEMFYSCEALTTIKVGANFLTTNVTTSASMFNGCTALKGGSNSTLAVVQADGIAAADSYTAKYARVDGGTAATRGYFTAA